MQPDDAPSPFHRDGRPNQQLRAHRNRHVTLTGTVAPSHVLTTLSTAHTHCYDGRRREQEKPIIQIRPRRQEKKKRKAAGRDNGDPESGLMTTPKRKKVGSPTKKLRVASTQKKQLEEWSEKAKESQKQFQPGSEEKKGREAKKSLQRTPNKYSLWSQTQCGHL